MFVPSGVLLMGYWTVKYFPIPPLPSEKEALCFSNPNPPPQEFYSLLLDKLKRRSIGHQYYFGMLFFTVWPVLNIIVIYRESALSSRLVRRQSQ